MRIQYLFSISVLFAMAFATSCVNENAAEPDCNGTLSIMVESTAPQSTCSPADGSITVSASGGTSPYQYSLNGGAKQSSPTFSNLSKGVYSITVFDKNNCEKEVSNVEITFPSSTLDFDVVKSSDTECLTDNGSITITASGGSGGYTYSKDNGLSFQADASFTGLAPANYSVVIKDENGCTVTKSVPVAQGVTGVTYTEDILPILNAKCSGSGCHPGHGDWFTYKTAKENAATIKTKTGDRSMPKVGSLTAEQIALIACWVNDGAPQ